MKRKLTVKNIGLWAAVSTAVLLVGAAGWFAVAAVSGLVFEAEGSSLSGPASIISILKASGGKAVRFGSGAAPSPSPTAKPSPKATPAPASACGTAGEACTTAEIAKHNSASNCWVIYQGSYYNVTSFVSKHEGGSNVFDSHTCGHDIEPFLDGSQGNAGKTHEHNSEATQILETYKVGPVSP